MNPCDKGSKLIIFPYFEVSLGLSHNQFAYKSSTGCLNAITLLKENIFHYNQRHSDVFCAMIDLSQAYDATESLGGAGSLRPASSQGLLMVTSQA